MDDINKRCQKLAMILPHDFEWGGGVANCKEGEIPQFPYVKYAKSDIEWIKQFYSLNLIDNNYLQHVEIYGLGSRKVETMTREEILSLLTYYIRQDRFCEGLLAENIESGKITKLVQRLHKVTKE